MLYHNEPLLRDGEVVGYISSGNYGHALGAAVGLGYVPCREPGEGVKSMLASTYTVDVAGQRCPARVSAKPLYDPKGERVRA